MPQKFYAHSLPGRPMEEWQLLEKHLRKMAGMARECAESSGAGDWSYLAGLWYDLGREKNGLLC
jgi:CRISPR-associated endonuclease/helicase Cas3